MKMEIDPTRHVAYTHDHAYQLFYVANNEGGMSEANNLLAVFRRVDGWVPEMAIHYFEEEREFLGIDDPVDLSFIVTPNEEPTEESDARAVEHIRAARKAELWTPNGRSGIYYIVDRDEAKAVLDAVATQEVK
jgi:hypothetical protein